MKLPSRYSLDTELIASAISQWAKIESPSYDSVAVNRMMDAASCFMATMGARIERVAGSESFGDVVTARFGSISTQGILVLGHLDTVHLVGTLQDTLPIRMEGDRLYGPGVMDMKGGMYIELEADIPTLVKNLASNRNEKFDKVLNASDIAVIDDKVIMSGDEVLKDLIR